MLAVSASWIYVKMDNRMGSMCNSMARCVVASTSISVQRPPTAGPPPNAGPPLNAKRRQLESPSSVDKESDDAKRPPVRRQHEFSSDDEERVCAKPVPNPKWRKISSSFEEEKEMDEDDDDGPRNPLLSSTYWTTLPVAMTASHR